ncbi:MAG TPA: hypothetical protein VFD21_12855 [Vicinamibacterales bacterium]|jgi:hypothetical protein|nr:hypothetical protein [Vicinamibacterales bacterium]
MRRLQSLLCLLMLGGGVSGCEGFFLVVSTGPLPDQKLSPTAPPPVTVIAVGDLVHGTFVTPQVCFDVRAPASGILFVNLQWDPREGDIDFTFVSSVFATNVTTVSPGGQTSAVRSLRVTRGQSYRIQVVGDRGPVPFTLTTSLQ